jgi:hypothetical protein
MLRSYSKVGDNRMSAGEIQDFEITFFAWFCKVQRQKERVQMMPMLIFQKLNTDDYCTLRL